MNNVKHLALYARQTAPVAVSRRQQQPQPHFEGRVPEKPRRRFGPMAWLAAGVVGLSSLVAGCDPGGNTATPTAPVASAPAAGQVQRQTTPVPLKLQINPSWFGKAVDGQLDGQAIEIRIDPALFGKTVTGTFQGQPVNLKESLQFVSKNVSGTIAGQKVNFDVSPTFFGKHVKGTFMGKPVDLQTSPTFFGIRLQGDFQGNTVDITLNPDFIGKDLDGSFGGQKVHLDIRPSWFGREVSGTAQVQDHQSFNQFIAFLLSDLHLLRTSDKD